MKFSALTKQQPYINAFVRFWLYTSPTQLEFASF